MLKFGEPSLVTQGTLQNHQTENPSLPVLVRLPTEIRKVHPFSDSDGIG